MLTLSLDPNVPVDPAAKAAVDAYFASPDSAADDRRIVERIEARARPLRPGEAERILYGH